MAIIFMDGFDHYTRTNIGTKWDYTSGGPFGGPGGGETFWLVTSWVKTGNYSGGLSNTWILKRLLANYSTLYTGFWLKCTANVDQKFMGFYDGDTNQLNIRRNAAGAILAYRGDTLLGTSAETGLILLNEVHIQVKAVLHTSAGSVEVVVNGVTKLLLENINTAASGNNYSNVFRLEHNYGSGVGIYYDDFWLDDAEFLGPLRIEPIYPGGVGDSAGFVPSAGSNWECVNDLIDGTETDYVEAVTPNTVDLYHLKPMTILEGNIKAIQTHMVGRKTDSGNLRLIPIIKPSSNNIEGNPLELYDCYTRKSHIYQNNPENSQPWTVQDINNMQIGFKLIE